MIKHRLSRFPCVPSGWSIPMLLFVLLLPGCTATRYLPPGETFYNGAEIDFEMPQGNVRRRRTLETEMQEYIVPKPNDKILGSRPWVWVYYVVGTPKKEKGLRSFLKKKIGQEPVLLRDATPERSAKLLAGYLNNEGYFESKVVPEVKKGKTQSTVIYHTELHRPYRLQTITYPKGRDSTYAAVLRTLREKSILRPNIRYDLERLQAEQERIEEEVENVGFFYFDDRYLIFEADSTVGKKKVDLRLRLEKDIPPRARKIYRLDKIDVLPNYVLSTDTLPGKGYDTALVNHYRYIDNKHAFRPRIITDVINLKKGALYSREARELSLSHLMGLGTFKFVNIKFTESPRQDSSLLDAQILLTPLKKKSLRAEVQATSKSNNFVGPGVAFTFTNRNFLRGAELFQLKLTSAYEVQVSKQVSQPVNSLELGLESSLTIPRFITPIRIDYKSSRYLPKTVFKAAVNVQNRMRYYRLNSFNIGYGYNWRESSAKSHELFPIDIAYVETKTTPKFDSLLRGNTILAGSFVDQFIAGTRYSYTLNTQLSEEVAQKYERRKFREHNFYFNGNIDVAGNLLNSIQRVSGIKPGLEEDGRKLYTLFNSPYSQYVRGDFDFRYYWQWERHSKLATRAVAGIGYAYSNSTIMPYIKQFAIGGSNSIRAFPARSIGPGSYLLDLDKAFFIDQRGDIKLEANAEYRICL
ncbi:translocation and assembly module lipoprotein TamL [Dawidia soli]|uniref:BamA/TamA family outer membrane protein n=1 Tax=Dawidia soli TaxID=2782352 RepID=A0AAP2DGV6_9BACT|nr:BamA/TamA family outer membrane protein [Dawidia soli]MBT1690836.1 BamA/TamA family outer membrane protein [Dawidia soli]